MTSDTWKTWWYRSGSTLHDLVVKALRALRMRSSQYLRVDISTIRRSVEFIGRLAAAIDGEPTWGEGPKREGKGSQARNSLFTNRVILSRQRFPELYRAVQVSFKSFLEKNKTITSIALSTASIVPSFSQISAINSIAAGTGSSASSPGSGFSKSTMSATVCITESGASGAGSGFVSLSFDNGTAV